MSPSQSNATLFKNATVFDGTGSAPFQGDVWVEQGRIKAIGNSLHVDGAQVVDCSGQWLMPGLLDIHTHLDLEVEVAPGLPEVVRHGTTTVVMSNCSLGVAFGHQRKNGDDPIVDCFARVENVPKPVLSKVAEVCTWNNTADYLTHFDHLNLGPNVVPLVPHSMLRIEVMGVKDSVTRDPSDKELRQMEQLLDDAMRQGYPGFSTDGLPFHFLANQPNTRKQIPTQFATFKELKKLTDIVRRHGRVWQATPPKDSTFKTARNFLLTSGRLFGKALKVTATAAIDLHTNRSIARLGLLLSWVLNSKLIRGHFRFQALSASFRVWSDGVICPVAEEIPELRRLNELELDDRAGRIAMMNDPTWVADFKAMWNKGKSGFNLANLLRILKREHNVLNRRFDDMHIDTCPLPEWNGLLIANAYSRVVAFQTNGTLPVNATEAELALIRNCPSVVGDEAEFMLYLLRQWDTDFRWSTTVANRNPDMTKRLLFHPLTIPGFNDSGAHLTNLAFYDGNLRTLKFAQEDGMERVSTAVHRLTQAPAELFGLNTGLLRPGAQADLCVVNPEALHRWNPEHTYETIYRDIFETKMLVNRPEGVVRCTMIAGHMAWFEGEFTPAFGAVKMGRLLRDRDHPAEVQHGQAVVEVPASSLKLAVA